MREKPLILVVDDEGDARTFLTSLLANEGYEVAACSNGHEALAAVEKLHPDLVVSDERMPEMEGTELLGRIRAMSPATRVVLYSAYADWPMFMETLDKGGADVIPKGASNREILRIVRGVLEEVPA